MRCNLCGQPIIEEGRFCGACGAPLPYVIETGKRRRKNKYAETYLDGRSVPEEERMEPPPGPLHPQAPIGLMDWTKENPLFPRRRKKIKRFYPGLIPGKSGFFRKIFFLFVDPQFFFARLDMEKEILSATAYLFLVIGLSAGLLAASSHYMGVPGNLELYHAAAFFAFGFAFMFLASAVGSVMLTAFYRRWAGRRRVFAVLAFTSLPLCVVPPALALCAGSVATALPGVLVIMLSFMLFVSFCATGMECEFGTDPLASAVWGTVIIITSAFITSSILFVLQNNFGLSLARIFKGMM